jgi:hypothetical protein
MTTGHWTDALHGLNACRGAIDWAGGYDSLAAAWAACERGDWMLWLAGRVAGPPGDDTRRPLVLAACACARLALPYVPDGEERPLRAIETAEAWARGDTGVTLEQVRFAAADADAAFVAATAAYVDATYGAFVATCAAIASSAYDVEAAGDRVATLRQCADLVREYYPTPPVLPEAGE